MVIHGHKIQAAGCTLPLTQKTNFPKEFGSRHKSAIGITEVANVIAIVVSEETGIVSVAKKGEVTRFVEYDTLNDILKEYYWNDLYSSNKKKRGQ